MATTEANYVSYLQYDALLIQKKQYESMLNREPPFELSSEQKLLVEALLKEANTRIKELEQE